MLNFDTSEMADAWATAVLRAIARDEVAGRRPARLTERDLSTWKRFRGRLGSADLFHLLAEDGAVGHQVLFSARDLGCPGWARRVNDEMVDRFLMELPTIDLAEPSSAYLEDQARRLGVSTRLARSELHQVKPHQKVLELPGTGGQLSHHLVATQPGLTLQQNFTVACEGAAELALAGIAALDLAAPNTDFIVAISADDLKNPQHPLRQKRFDFVVGLRPDKGGKFLVADHLALWFHGAKALLV